MIRADALGSEPDRPEHNSSMLDRVVWKDQPCPDDADAGLVKAREHARKPAVESLRVVIEMNNVPAAAGTRTLVARCGETKIALVSNHPHPRKFCKYGGRLGPRAVVDDNDLTLT